MVTSISLFAVLLGVTIARFTAPAPPKEVALSAALAEVRAGDIVTAKIDDQANTVTLTRGKDAGGKQIVASYPFAYSGELTKALLDKDVKTTTEPPTGPNPFVSMLVNLLPLVICAPAP